MKATEKGGKTAKGNLGTFVVRVQHRHNSTWQGKVVWSDKNQTRYFRSIWELIRLMESAIGEDPAKEESRITWEHIKEQHAAEEDPS